MPRAEVKKLAEGKEGRKGVLQEMEHGGEKSREVRGSRS